MRGPGAASFSPVRKAEDPVSRGRRLVLPASSTTSAAGQVRQPLPVTDATGLGLLDSGFEEEYEQKYE